MKKSNYSRWILGVRGFYETYSIDIKIPNSDIVVFINYGLMSPEDIYDPSFQLWGFVCYKNEPQKNFGIKETFKLSDGVFAKDADFVRIKNSSFKEDKANGVIKGENHSIKWNVLIKDWRKNQLYPFDFLYNMKYPQSKTVTPVLKGLFDGEIEIDSVKYTLDNAIGSQSHFWGDSRPLRWNWGYANIFENNDETLFESFVSRRKLPISLETPDMSLFVLKNKGKEYKFNMPQSILLNQSDYHIGYWNFKAETLKHKIVGSYQVEYKNLVAIKEKDTVEENMFLHCTPFAKLTIDLYEREVWSFKKINTFVSNNAYVEFVTRYKDPHVNLIIN